MKSAREHLATLEWSQGAPDMEALISRVQVEAYNEGVRYGQGTLMAIAEATATRIDNIGDGSTPMGLSHNPKT